MAKKRGNVKWIILSVIFLIVIVALILLVLNFNNLVPSKQNTNKPYIEPKVYEKFDKGEKYVNLIVKLDSNQEAVKLLKSLPKAEFIYENNSILLGDGFAGYATKKGLEIIMKDIHVTKIYYNGEVSVALG